MSGAGRASNHTARNTESGSRAPYAAEVPFYGGIPQGLDKLGVGNGSDPEGPDAESGSPRTPGGRDVEPTSSGVPTAASEDVRPWVKRLGSYLRIFGKQTAFGFSQDGRAVPNEALIEMAKRREAEHGR